MLWLQLSIAANQFRLYWNHSAFVAGPNTINDPPWYLDSGVIDHVTANLSNLSLKEDYKAKGKLVISYGNDLSVTYTSNIIINSSRQPLMLNKILNVMGDKPINLYVVCNVCSGIILKKNHINTLYGITIHNVKMIVTQHISIQK